jgi:hypothetical protein
MTLNLVADSIVFRPKRNQADFAVFFLTFGRGATAAFMFVLDVFNAAHRLICACRIRSRTSALILRRFLAF